MVDLDPYAELLRQSNEILATPGGRHGQLDDGTPVIIEPLGHFLHRDLPKSESLVGVERQGTNLLPRYGWVLPWGREGCGKTSVLVDLLFHAGSGVDWFHYRVPRPIRFVVVINEGIPGGLQDKLAEKVEVWEGDTEAVKTNLSIYASPWGEFTFRHPQLVEHLRDYATEFKADYVAFDPLYTIGPSGSGTPQETEEFKHVLRRFGLWDDLGVITAHHSNKAGMVSGDWGRHPDTVIHLERDGQRPATKLTVQKARPADPAEIGVPQILEWVPETIGYHRIVPDAALISDTEILEGIYAAVDGAGQITITALRTSVPGGKDRVADLAKAEIEAGRLVNISTRKRGITLSRPNSSAQLHWTNGRMPEKGEQTRMVEPNNSSKLPLDESAPHPMDVNSSVRPQSPVRGRTNFGRINLHEYDRIPPDLLDDTEPPEPE